MCQEKIKKISKECIKEFPGLEVVFAKLVGDEAGGDGAVAGGDGAVTGGDGAVAGGDGAVASGEA